MKLPLRLEGTCVRDAESRVIISGFNPIDIEERKQIIEVVNGAAKNRRAAEKLRKALECVATRLKVFNRDGIRDEQARWIGHTLDIAEAVLDETNDAAREMIGGLNGK